MERTCFVWCCRPLYIFCSLHVIKPRCSNPIKLLSRFRLCGPSVFGVRNAVVADTRARLTQYDAVKYDATLAYQNSNELDVLVCSLIIFVYILCTCTMPIRVSSYSTLLGVVELLLLPHYGFKSLLIIMITIAWSSGWKWCFIESRPSGKRQEDTCRPPTTTTAVAVTEIHLVRHFVSALAQFV